MKRLEKQLQRPSATFLFVVVSVASVTLILSYDLLFFAPTARRLALVQSDLLRRERGLALSARLIADHPRVLARVRAGDSPTLARLGISNPAVELLTRSAATRGLELQGIDPGAPVDEGGKRRTPIELRVTGSFDALLDWLHEIEASEVVAVVDRVRVEGAPSGHHVAQVTLSTYVAAKGG
jgi:type II secretory pathway component PulM